MVYSIQNFENALLRHYAMDRQYRNYLHRYYLLFIGQVLTASLNDRVSESNAKGILTDLYEDIFDLAIAENKGTFVGINCAITNATEETIRIRFGNHSDEYRDAEKYLGYIEIIFREIEKLTVKKRVAIRVSFIGAIAGELKELYKSVYKNVKVAEEELSLKLIGMQLVKVGYFFSLICEARTSLLQIKK